MDPFDDLDRISGPEQKKWINVTSVLEGLDGGRKDIRIELMEDGAPRAIAFFDIDGTLAHLSAIHGEAIRRLFPVEEPKELESTYYRGFKLGNSLREFDRMRGIYEGDEHGEKHPEWKDPEIYIKERLALHKEEIDQTGHELHDVAAGILAEYGKIAATLCDELYKNKPEEFKKANITPIFKLAEMYSRMGIPMVGFTANAKVLVDKLAKYLGLSDIFLDIATDETMSGGSKEVAIHYLLLELKAKGIPIPKNRARGGESQLIFVGDSLRGDIGTSLLARLKDKEISGQGILVLQNKTELRDTIKQINTDPDLRRIVDNVRVSALVVDEVKYDSKGNPMMYKSAREDFLVPLS